jgi:hypothetical protein
MKLKLFFSFVAIMSCLAILLAVVVNFPHSVHASVDGSFAQASTPTITVSPTVIDVSQCSYLNITDFISCPVTLSLHQPRNNGVIWTSSYKSTLCLYNKCNPDFYVAVLPSKGSLSAASPSAQVNIIVSDYCYHGYENATITFAIPGSTAKVKYNCYQP